MGKGQNIGQNTGQNIGQSSLSRGIQTALGLLAPYLAFTDLISGPSTGLDDGSGSGVIVTVWGFGFGSTQGTSTITFTDALGITRNPAHIYYWKNADGVLPSGPANLHESHGMQEIAFSMPSGSATGAGFIRVMVDGEISNTLPFTVRTGSIYHVRSTGTGAGIGTYTDPYLTVDEAEASVSAAGSTIYIHDVNAGSDTTDHGIWAGESNAGVDSFLVNQFFYAAYPGNQPTVTGRIGFAGRSTSGQCCSKLDVYSSSHIRLANGQLGGQLSNGTGPTTCIEGVAHGRIIGNKCNNQTGGTASESQGAIKANALGGGDEISNLRIFGNEISNYGSEGSETTHHTMYVSIRDNDGGGQYPPYELAWNYLHDCWAKNGIHYFDEDKSAPLNNGDWTGPVKIHDNVVVNQSGAGISLTVQDFPQTNDWYIYNNIIINAGLVSEWDGLDVATASGSSVSSSLIIDPTNISGDVFVFNNIIHRWNTDNYTGGSRSAIGISGGVNTTLLQFSNNILLGDQDKPFVATFSASPAELLDMFTGTNNAWYTTAATKVNAITPTWDLSPIETDPLLTFVGPIASVGEGSPVIDGGTTPPIPLLRDIYSAVRTGTIDVGAVERSA